MVDFPKKYDFNEREANWQKFWQDNDIYKWDRSISRDQTYVIDTPPPTVSGQLHIGHVFSYTHTDFIARFKRMQGMNVFYPIGFDDNGLPTERLVEKQKKIRASSISRQEFVKICEEVVVSEEENFKTLFNSIALSVDWSQQYRTISDNSTAISQMSFLDLVQKGQIYRDSQPMLWDPVDQTALSQADIEEHERITLMNEIEFQTEDGKAIIIATTRPELLPACVAIFFHPDDLKYQHLAGKFAFSPLFGVRVPILGDDMVDPEKGTGLVMCCTFGDQTDILWWRKHKLPTKIIFSKYGTIEPIEFDDSCRNKEIAHQFAAQIEGLKISEARTKIIDILKQEQLLVGQLEKTQLVKCAERSGAPLEILTTPQWFIKSVEHKEALTAKSDELNWYPKTMKIKLDSWIKGVSLDWCISRQRYFGVPFPVWYSKRAGEEGKLLFAQTKDLPVDPLKDLPEGYSRDEIEPDHDVMDTWSTSSVSPQLNSHGIASGYMLDKQRHEALFPADLRPQAHEILRTWAYYTMLKSHLHEGVLPWKNIMVSGWCLAQDRSKMSKSKGNIVAPRQLLEQFGSDVVRYWASSAKLGADTAYSDDTMKNGKRLINKLWNAAKFVSQYFDSIPTEIKSLSLEQVSEYIYYEMDKYFLKELGLLVQRVTDELKNYEYANAIAHIEEFFWKIFCDNYLEIVKTRAYNEDGQNASGALSAHLALYHGLKIILKIFAPFLPHITEEIYQLLYVDKESIGQLIGQSIHSKGSWPEVNADSVFADYNQNDAEQLIKILELVRKVKAKDNLSIKAPIAVIEIIPNPIFKSNIVARRSPINIGFDSSRLVTFNLENGIRQMLNDNLIMDLKQVTSAQEIKFVDKLSNADQQLFSDDFQINVIYSV